MKPLNIYWLNPPLYTRSIYPDLAWMNFNTYLPEYNWIQPIFNWEDYSTIEQVIDHILEHDVDVFCISTYTWNYILCHEIAKRIKEINSKIIIIKGGPHQGYDDTFFENHPYIDYLCYATGHGEHFFKEALQEIQKYGTIKNLDSVPYLITKDFKSLILKSKFIYPKESAIEKNYDYLIELKLFANRENKEINILYETTRGCPYSCTYCEWGGGISTKVSDKPLDIVLKELEIISLIGFSNIEIIDANFGILDRDETIAKYIATLKQKYNYPKQVMLYGLAKTSVKKKEKILDVLFENKLMNDYFVAVQSLNAEVLQNIKRTDISLDDQLKLANKYKTKYGVKPSIEFIMGLPGSTLEDFFKEMDYFQILDSDSCWNKMRNIFTLLPDTPAADKEYIKKHKIKISEVGTMENEENEGFHISKSVINKFKSTAFFVTETYSYTQEEWKIMFLLNRMQRRIGVLIKSNIVASEFFKIFLTHLQQTTYYLDIKKHLDKIVSGELKNKDILLFKNNILEDVILKEYVLQNHKFYKQYLDI
jgi:putative methyltransferase